MLREELRSGSETITARIRDTDEALKLSHDLSPGEREVIRCGGLLSYLRRQNGASATQSRRAGLVPGQRKGE